MSAALTFRLGTLLFWLALAALWIAAPPPLPREAEPAPAAATATAAPGHTLAEVARHARADDCWMAIGGEVYDLSAYVERHPAEPEVLLPWCGREATQAYRTKMRDRPHSARADGLLVQYRIGPLRDAAPGDTPAQR